MANRDAHVTLSDGSTVIRERGHYGWVDLRSDYAGLTFQVQTDGTLIIVDGADAEAFAPGQWTHVELRNRALK
jgi:hypothetical protein